MTAVLFALAAAPSFGQTLSLSAESFETTPGLGEQTTFGAFTCDKDGTTVIPFQTQGAAFGPYVGTFVETGTITIGPQTDTALDLRGMGTILSFQASFTINSQFPPATVTGTKQLAPNSPMPANMSALGRCDPDGSSPPTTDIFVVVSNPFVLYTAQINAATGSRSDSGTSSVAIQSTTNPAAPRSFQESFTSTEPVCEDGNNGNGVGSGHEKKNKDNDDNEHCG